MPVTGPIPDWLLSAVAIATVFAVMFDLGLAMVPGEFRWVVMRPGLMLRGLFSVLVAVPALAWIIARAFDLPRAAEIGIVLMAISPGAPVALRRSLGAGGHQAYAPALQIGVAVLAVVSMPLSIAAFNEYYGGHAEIAPGEVARQVFVAQLLPLALGMLVTRVAPARAGRLEPTLRRIAGLLLIALVVLALLDIWKAVLGAGPRVALAVVTVTVLALAAGHLLGGPDPATRTATAVSSAARNAGLALLVAALNHAQSAINAAVLAYFVVSALTVIPYVVWRRRAIAPAGKRD
jgi:predicted Na+-dependent transporter